jgi:hypothetical protein
MNKGNHFVKILNKTILIINSLLEKNLNKLNFINFRKKKIRIIGSNRLFLIITATIILFLSYLSIPHIYNQKEISNEIKNRLLTKFGISFIFSKNFSYKFFPRPHFLIEGASIIDNQVKISNIEKVKVYVSLDNLFSLKNLTLNDLILEKANFNLNKQNYNFFLKLLDNKFVESNFKIKDSNIFYRNRENEVLFINKILSMKYYYDINNLKNTLYSKNKIFNIPYSYTITNDKINKKISSEINLDILKLQVNNEINYSDNKKNGVANILYNKKKSKATYDINNGYFNLYFLDESKKSKFNSEFKINFKPFYMIAETNLEDIDVINLSNGNSILVQLLKTEILNHKNLDLTKKIKLKNNLNHKSNIKSEINLKIQEGLIDINNTSFIWSDHLDFEISNSLLYVDDNNLILDGKLIINIANYNNIYKFLQTPRNNRVELKIIELDFNYNFDQRAINFNNMKINDVINQKINKILREIILKETKLQNKVYLKNLINLAIKSYAG